MRGAARVVVVLALMLACSVHADAASWAVTPIVTSCPSDSPTATPSPTSTDTPTDSPSPTDTPTDCSSTTPTVVTVDGFGDFAAMVNVALAFLVFLSAASFVLLWKR